MTGKDWMPASRGLLLVMAKSWFPLLKTRGVRDWKMNEEEVNNFERLVAEAENELNRPANQRTAITNNSLKRVFEELKKLMRDLKRRYFLVPPLTEGEIILLGLKLKDTTPTVIEAPVKAAECEMKYPARGMVELSKIKAVGEGGDNRANYGVRICYGIIGEPTDRDKFRLSKAPETGSDLPHSVFTRKKSHKFDFSEDRGKPVYFCLRFENSKGQTGPWGMIYETFVP